MIGSFFWSRSLLRPSYILEDGVFVVLGLALDLSVLVCKVSVFFGNIYSQKLVAARQQASSRFFVVADLIDCLLACLI
jgi:hypothetical protein